MTNDDIEKKVAVLAYKTAEKLEIVLGSSIAPMREAFAQAIREAKVEAYEEAARLLESYASVHSDPVRRAFEFQRDAPSLVRALRDSLVQAESASIK